MSGERVRRVQPAEAQGGLRVTAGQMAGQRWQRGAHEDGRRRERGEGKAEAGEAEEGRRQLEGRVRGAIEVGHAAEQGRRRERDGRDEHLEDAVEPERRPDPIGEPATPEAADGHSREEPGEDRGDRLGRVPEHEDQLACPHDLVDETGGT